MYEKMKKKNILSALLLAAMITGCVGNIPAAEKRFAHIKTPAHAGVLLLL